MENQDNGDEFQVKGLTKQIIDGLSDSLIDLKALKHAGVPLRPERVDLLIDQLIIQKRLLLIKQK